MSVKRVRSARHHMHKRWEKMRAYCRDPKQKTYKYVGGLGIQVCERWDNSFEDYLTDVGYPPDTDRTFLERIDKSKNFEPGNMRWVTKTELVQNTNVVTRVTYQGQELTLKQLAKHTDIPYEILCTRLKEGLSVEDAMTRPIRDDVSRFVEYLGKSYTIAELAKETNLSGPMLYGRIFKQGYTVEEAVNKPPKKRKVASTLAMYTYMDRTMTLKDWAAELKVPYQTLCTRLRRYNGDLAAAANHVRGASTRPKLWQTEQK